MSSQKKPSRPRSRPGKAKAEKPAPPQPLTPPPDPHGLEWDKRYGIVRALHKTAKRYIEQELPKDIRSLNLQPTIKAEVRHAQHLDKLQCLICGKRLELPMGRPVRYAAHLIGWDAHEQRRGHPSYIGRICLLCLKGGPQKGLTALSEHVLRFILARYTYEDLTRAAFHREDKNWSQVEDLITFFKLMRAGIARASSWWPATARALQQLDEHAHQETARKLEQSLRGMSTRKCTCGYPILISSTGNWGEYFDGQRNGPNFFTSIKHCPQCGQWLIRVGLLPSGEQKSVTKETA